MASLKEEGNAHYRCRNFQAAEDCYTRALEDASPDDALREVLYLNRSAARLGLRDWAGAEQDANEALQVAEKAGRPGSWKAYLRRGIGHRQGARSAEADLLRAFQLAPAEMKRKVAAELSLNYAMTQMGLMDSAAEYGLADGRVTHVGHPVHTSNPLAGLIKYGSFTPLDMIRVRMHQHVEAGPDMDCILGPDACPDPSIWLAKKTKLHIIKLQAGHLRFCSPKPRAILGKPRVFFCREMASLKEEGNTQYRAGNFQAAESCYTRALEDTSADADALGKEVLYLNRSAARLGLRNWLGAEQDGNEALQLAEKAGRAGSWKAYLRRGIGHRQQAYSAEADLLKAFELAPAAMKRRVAAELSLNFSMTRMGLDEVGREYGLPDGRVRHVGHPKYCDNPLAGVVQYGSFTPPVLICVKMDGHNRAGPEMDCILGPGACPDPSVWLRKSKE